MEEVNGAYKHSRYEKNWMKSLCTMSNIKVKARWPAGQLAGQTKTIPCNTDPYIGQPDNSL